MSLWSPLILILTLLPLISAGVASAGLPGARAVGTIEICAAEGARHIAVDASGQPVTPGMPCDCGLCLACVTLPVPLLPDPAGLPLPLTTSQDLSPVPPALPPAPARALRPMARGPPARHPA